MIGIDPMSIDAVEHIVNRGNELVENSLELPSLATRVSGLTTYSEHLTDTIYLY